ncbi:hypothetical protein BDV59DRAFT_124247 [Aspergillus ambiguus]|uniref:uncharacterized protein n=1 Tax=Aspergillus ambiguus TaxID=176160 RepID=UPI003CCCA6FA
MDENSEIDWGFALYFTIIACMLTSHCHLGTYCIYNIGYILLMISGEFSTVRMGKCHVGSPEPLNSTQYRKIQYLLFCTTLFNSPSTLSQLSTRFQLNPSQHSI